MGTHLITLKTSWWAQFWEAFVEKLKGSFGNGNIGEEIRHGILQWKTEFTIGGKDFLLTDAVIVTWIAVFLFILLLIWLSAPKKSVPKGRQFFMESVVSLILSVCKSSGMNEKQAETVAPMVGTIGCFLIACNVSSLFKITPPAKNIAFPFALAFFTIFYVIGISIRFVGVKGFIGSLLDPTPVMFPFKIIDYIIKPMSLALRLFGNIFGSFILMEFLYLVIPLIVPGIFGLWFDLADGILQAVVFSYLTMSYIGEIVEGAEAHKEHAAEKAKAKAEMKAQKALEEKTIQETEAVAAK
ncbi:MAG TPA: FoF1 ATP synthase subunit a [Bacillota bacterium]|nr:FoF1 ATP synthase subunit a [Bacillota bacterium]HPE39387.1 FoF1 ATP synthase subunit a [Bacillota bacterium]